MKILRILLYLIVAVIALFLIIGLFAKKDFHLERTAVIDAPKSMVYDQVRFFKNEPNWSPWLPLDPQVKTKIEGEDGSVGCVYNWDGNDDVGKGSQKITSLDSNLIKTDVRFEKPFKSQAASFFSVNQADGGGTKVVWGFDMKMPYPWNAFAMFTDLNKAIGKDYEKGLKNLQEYCESLVGPKVYEGQEVKIATLPVRFFASTAQKQVAMNDIAAFLATNYGILGKALAAQKLEMDGAPGGFYWSGDMESGEFPMAAAVAFKNGGKPAPNLGKEITVSERGGKALIVDFYGAYEKTGEAHASIKACMEEKGLESIPPVLEEYITDPTVEKDTAKWLTRVTYFVQPKPTEEN